MPHSIEYNTNDLEQGLDVSVMKTNRCDQIRMVITVVINLDMSLYCQVTQLITKSGNLRWNTSVPDIWMNCNNSSWA